MKTKKPGETIFIPVSVKPGAFSKECLVTFESTDGPVSGFVSADHVLEKDGHKVIEAKVVSSDKGSVSVYLRGSFFTTTGLAHIKTAA